MRQLLLQRTETGQEAARVEKALTSVTMKIRRSELVSFDFEGLRIADYTAGKDVSSSVAEISVPPADVRANATICRMEAESSTARMRRLLISGLRARSSRAQSSGLVR